jgi:type IV fimbrial biogenesis protein FimT
MTSMTRIVARRGFAGFTLMEVIVVVAILGILATVGVPSMRDLIASTKVRGAVSDVYSSLILARSEAIKRNGSVDVIPSVATNWGAGWTVRVTGATENLTAREAITNDVTLGGPASSIRYRGDGRLVDPATGSLFTAEVPFTFRATNFSHVPLRCINVDPSGRPSVRTDKDRDATNGCNG